MMITINSKARVNNPKNKVFNGKTGKVIKLLEDTGTEEAYLEMDEAVNGVRYIYVATKRLIPVKPS